MGRNFELSFQLTVAKNLDEFLAVCQVSSLQLLDSDLGEVLFLSKLLECREVYSEILLVVDVLEASLRNATLQRHLTTFETNLSLVA